MSGPSKTYYSALPFLISMDGIDLRKCLYNASSIFSTVCLWWTCRHMLAGSRILFCLLHTVLTSSIYRINTLNCLNKSQTQSFKGLTMHCTLLDHCNVCIRSNNLRACSAEITSKKGIMIDPLCRTTRSVRLSSR